MDHVAMKDLTAAYQQFVPQYLTVMHKVAQRTSQIQRDRLRFEDTGLRQTKEWDVPYEEIIRQASKECLRNAEILKSVQVLWNKVLSHLPLFPLQDNASSTPNIPEAVLPYVVGSLARPVYDAMVKRQAVNVGLDDAVNEFDRYAEPWTWNRLEWQVTAPLLLFNSDGDYVVEQNLRIGPLLKEEKNEILDRFWVPYPTFPLVDIGMLSPTHGRMLWSTKSSIGGQVRTHLERDVHERFRRICGDVLTALRLIHEGMVGCERVFFVCTGPGIHPVEARVWYEDAFRTTNYGTSYQLTAADTSTLRQEIGLVRKRMSSTAIRLACDRFNQSYSRQWLADRLIDLIVALESLLTDKDDLSYKFRMRGAAVLKNRRGPEIVYEQLREIYNARSSIVHDGKKLETLKIDLSTCEMLCQDVLQAVMENYDTLVIPGNGTDKQRLTAGIDKAILACLRPSATADDEVALD